MPKNELDILLPESEIVINGETIVIRPFPFAKLPKVISLLSSIGVGLYELLKPESGLTFSGDNIIINDTLLEKISVVIQDHFPEVCELMGIYTNKPKDFFLGEENGVNGEDGVIILLSIMERNYGFFTKRLSPTLTQLKTKAKEKGKK